MHSVPNKLIYVLFFLLHFVLGYAGAQQGDIIIITTLKCCLLSCQRQYVTAYLVYHNFFKNLLESHDTEPVRHVPMDVRSETSACTLLVIFNCISRQTKLPVR